MNDRKECPRQPTPEMFKALRPTWQVDICHVIWQAMYDAAPAPAAEPPPPAPQDHAVAGAPSQDVAALDKRLQDAISFATEFGDRQVWRVRDVLKDAAAALDALERDAEQALAIRADFAARNAELWERAEQAERELAEARELLRELRDYHLPGGEMWDKVDAAIDAARKGEK